MDSVTVELEANVDRLGSQFHDASDAAAERHDPSAAVGHFPVSGEGGLPGEIPTLLQVVVDEILKQKLIHVGQIGMTGYGPDVVHEKSQGPFARLDQNHGGRAYAEFSLAKDTGLCCRGEQQLRSDSPGHFAF